MKSLLLSRRKISKLVYHQNLLQYEMFCDVLKFHRSMKYTSFQQLVQPLGTNFKYRIPSNYSAPLFLAPRNIFAHTQILYFLI